MRIVRDLNQVSSSFDSCQREALTAFGRNEVFLEGAYAQHIVVKKYINTYIYFICLFSDMLLHQLPNH